MNAERRNGDGAARVSPNWPESRYGDFKRIIIEAYESSGLEINAQGDKIKVLFKKQGKDVLENNAGLETFMAKMQEAGFSLIEGAEIENDGNLWKEYTVIAHLKPKE